MKLTKHAAQRLKERAGLKQSSALRIAERALEQGIQEYEASGILRDYMAALYHSHAIANNIRIYGENVFIFNDATLITILNLPNQYKIIVRKLMLKKKEKLNAE